MEPKMAKTLERAFGLVMAPSLKGECLFLARQKSHETGQINPSAFLLEKQNSNETRYLHSLYI